MRTHHATEMKQGMTSCCSQVAGDEAKKREIRCGVMAIRKRVERGFGSFSEGLGGSPLSPAAAGTTRGSGSLFFSF